MSFQKEGDGYRYFNSETFELYYDASMGVKTSSGPENVINGANRPTLTASNTWISDVNDGSAQSLVFTLKEAKEISEVRITTQVELSYPCYSFGRKNISHGTASDLTVSLYRDGTWHEVAHITDNIFRHMCVSFEKQKAEKVTITVNKSINTSSAHIVEVRIYEDKAF